MKQLEQFVHFFACHFAFDVVIAGINCRTGFFVHVRAFVGQLQKNPALVVGRLHPYQQACFFQPCQNAGQAGAQYAGLICQILKIQSAVFRQQADDAPLLVGNARLVQNGAKVG